MKQKGGEWCHSSIGREADMKACFENLVVWDSKKVMKLGQVNDSNGSVVWNKVICRSENSGVYTKVAFLIWLFLCNKKKDLGVSDAVANVFYAFKLKEARRPMILLSYGKGKIELVTMNSVEENDFRKAFGNKASKVKAWVFCGPLEDGWFVVGEDEGNSSNSNNDNIILGRFVDTENGVEAKQVTEKELVVGALIIHTVNKIRGRENEGR